jgi:hypothetical protein
LNLDSNSQNSTLSEEPVQEPTSELLSLEKDDAFLLDMLAHRLEWITVQLKDVKLAITGAVLGRSTPKPMLSVLQHELALLQKELNSTLRILLASTAPSSSSMPGSAESTTD